MTETSTSQAVQLGTNLQFLNRIFQNPNSKCLLGCAQPLSFCIVRCRLRVCSNTSITKKDSLGLFHKGRILGYLRLSGLHFFSATLFLCKEQFYIFLCSKKLLHFFFRLAIVWVARFLFCQQLGIFRVQRLTLGNFFKSASSNAPLQLCAA